MRILVAEDEAKARRYLARGLGEQGYSIELAEDGNVALTMLREHTFDAAVLDVMLPGRDGWSIVQTMRSEAIRTPVLFLTARDHVEDRVRGFEIGGNDYLVKPFAFAELLARLRNLLRQGGSAGEAAMLRVGPLVIDALRHQVTRDHQPVQLTPKEYALLLLLARHRGRVLSRTLIAESVWGICFESQTNVVDVVIRRLRSKLDTPFAAPLLHTVRGVGYMLDSHED
ncbi:MAG: winged helix-turn-helix domain-containing protein [Xanthomonadaceae bacterium]|nr:winged helix-turn-helix domain-containing protein [Xanthomonadaceae bacterium]MDE2225252.1 winged helix-turn-helix domain-containing protein [Xanthomonadaceae bacterium]MDE2498248.1 winged helix-turn-helix domain-containing protein [Xanthomonadaceae bacterium]